MRMNFAFFAIPFSILCLHLLTASADLPMPPDMQKSVEKKWTEATCKDKKNLIICEYSAQDESLNECQKYRNQPKKYENIASKGSASWGHEKYCHLVGADRK